MVNQRLYNPPNDIKGKILTFEEWWELYGRDNMEWVEDPLPIVWEASMYHKEGRE